jgi:hypothetical protein
LGGAIALATADSVLMMEHAVYSVISPEGCASILWGTAEQSKEAAEVMKITAQDLKKMGIIDGIVNEPLGVPTATMRRRLRRRATNCGINWYRYCACRGRIVASAAATNSWIWDGRRSDGSAASPPLRGKQAD